MRHHSIEPLEARTLLAAGDLDLSFGTAGLAAYQIGFSSPHALAIQPDGKLLVAGHTGATANAPTDFLLLRLNPDGSLDPTFGDNGVVIHDLGAPNDSIRALVLDPDGNIVGGGITTGPETQTDFVLARFTPAGQLDPTFGDQGMVTTHLQNNDTLESLVLQPDGKILAAGTANASTTTPQIAINRYLPSGDLDPSFDLDGQLALSPNGTGTATAIAYHPTGRIIVAATRTSSLDNLGSIGLFALAPDGSFDHTFGVNGSITAYPAASVSVKDLAIDSQGRVLVISLAPYLRGYVTRFLPEGTLDASFGNAGHVQDYFGSSMPSTTRYAIAIQSDDRPVLGYKGQTLAGGTNTCGPSILGPTRLTSTGTIDQSFGALGIGQASPLTMRAPTDMLIQPDGAIVSLGDNYAGRIMLLRHHHEGEPVLTIDEQKIVTLRGTPGDDDLELRTYACGFDTLTFRRGSREYHIFATETTVKGIRIVGDAGNDAIAIAGDPDPPVSRALPGLPGWLPVTVLASDGDDHVTHGIIGWSRFTLNGQAGMDRLTLHTNIPFLHFWTTEHLTLRDGFIERGNAIFYAGFESIDARGNGNYQIAYPPPTVPLTLTGSTVTIDAVPAGPLVFIPMDNSNSTFAVNAGSFSFVPRTPGFERTCITVGRDGTVTLDGDQTFRCLLVDGGKITTTPGHHLITVSGTPDVRSSGTFDLADNSIIYHLPPALNPNPELASITSAIRRARNSSLGLWQGPGITSSVAAANPLTGLAAVINPGLTEFHGHPVGPSDILITHTWNGDANLDGEINADDYFRIDSGFLAQPAYSTYRDGNFNYDTVVNADDYFLIDSAFLAQPAPLAPPPPPTPRAGSTFSTTAIASPEPGTRTVRPSARPTADLLSRTTRRPRR